MSDPSAVMTGLLSDRVRRLERSVRLLWIIAVAGAVINLLAYYKAFG